MTLLAPFPFQQVQPAASPAASNSVLLFQALTGTNYAGLPHNMRYLAQAMAEIYKGAGSLNLAANLMDRVSTEQLFALTETFIGLLPRETVFARRPISRLYQYMCSDNERGEVEGPVYSSKPQARISMLLLGAFLRLSIDSVGASPEPVIQAALQALRPICLQTPALAAKIFFEYAHWKMCFQPDRSLASVTHLIKSGSSLLADFPQKKRLFAIPYLSEFGTKLLAASLTKSFEEFENQIVYLTRDVEEILDATSPRTSLESNCVLKATLFCAESRLCQAKFESAALGARRAMKQANYLGMTCESLQSEIILAKCAAGFGNYEVACRSLYLAILRTVDRLDSTPHLGPITAKMIELACFWLPSCKGDGRYSIISELRQIASSRNLERDEER